MKNHNIQHDEYSEAPRGRELQHFAVSKFTFPPWTTQLFLSFDLQDKKWIENSSLVISCNSLRSGHQSGLGDLAQGRSVTVRRLKKSSDYLPHLNVFLVRGFKLMTFWYGAAFSNLSWPPLRANSNAKVSNSHDSCAAVTVVSSSMLSYKTLQTSRIDGDPQSLPHLLSATAPLMLCLTSQMFHLLWLLLKHVRS